MNYKNIFGDIEFTIGNYFVPHRTGNTGKYTILKHEGFMVTDTYIVIEEHGSCFWEETPRFDSWIQAVRYLKENYKDLL